MLRALSILLFMLSFKVGAITLAEYKAQLSALSNQELWDKAIAHQVGGCYMQNATSGNCPWCFCNYYAKKTVSGTPNYQGLPADTGCLNIRNPSTSPCVLNFCAPTSSELQDGANRIRYAINQTGDVCNLQPIVTALNATSNSAYNLLQLVSQNKFVFTAISAVETKCYLKALTTAPLGTGQEVPLYKQSKRACRAAIRRFRALNNGQNPPVVRPSSVSAGVYLGSLNSQQIGQIYSQVQFSAMNDEEVAVAANPTLNTTAVSLAGEILKPVQDTTLIGTLTSTMEAQKSDAISAAATDSYTGAVSQISLGDATVGVISPSSTLQIEPVSN